MQIWKRLLRLPGNGTARIQMDTANNQEKGYNFCFAEIKNQKFKREAGKQGFSCLSFVKKAKECN